jgi:phosphoribosylformylglycinamidine synthase subunit PurSL
MLWHVRINPSPTLPDSLGARLALEAVESGLAGPWALETSRGFLIEGEITRQQLERVAIDVLVDPVAEVHTIGPSHSPLDGSGAVIHVMPKPGVTDPEGSSALELLRDLGYPVSKVSSIRTYRVHGPAESLPSLIERVLANDAVEMTIRGSLTLDKLGAGHPYRFRRVSVPIRDLNDAALLHLSRSGQLALSLPEMKCIQRHFAEHGREPTDCELETLAQTWSEHCSHKTLRGRIAFAGRMIDNLLKQKIGRASCRERV